MVAETMGKALTIKDKLTNIIEDAIKTAASNGGLGQMKDSSVPVTLEHPRLPEHGDLACGTPLKLASAARMAPIKIAETIAQRIGENPQAGKENITSFNAAPPGYINFHIGAGWLNDALHQILKQGADYGRSNLGEGQSVLLEYVSANPTGDLHIGHARGAVFGSSLANLLSFAGFKMHQEFYVNDCGEQIFRLGECAWALYQRRFGREVAYPETGYPEDSLTEYMDVIIAEHKDKFLALPAEEGLARLGDVMKKTIMEEQRKLLERMRVNFDLWFAESSLHQNNKVAQALEELHKHGWTYESEGALWLKAKELGDERDRVLRKSDGNTTYLANDTAYHKDKYDRGFNRFMTILGADHHGQVPGLRAVVKAMGNDPDRMEVILTQIVNLSRDGQIVRMSKRKGTVVTLAEVADEVGVDAVRYYLAESNPQNPISFDLELAKKTSRENPAYYIQYAHARCCAILRLALEPSVNADTKEMKPPVLTQAQWDAYNQDYRASAQAFAPGFGAFSNLKDLPDAFTHQKALVMCLEAFPEQVDEAASARLPGRLARYAYDVANYLMRYYETSRVITADAAVTKARLGVIVATKQVLANVLGIIGVSAPERM
jgi:arginyl-tRNA synthetase